MAFSQIQEIYRNDQMVQLPLISNISYFGDAQGHYIRNDQINNYVTRFGDDVFHTIYNMNIGDSFTWTLYNQNYLKFTRKQGGSSSQLLW